MNSTYPAFDRNSLPRHANNVALQGVKVVVRANVSTEMSDAGATLGASISPAKAKAAAANGKKGGRPVGS